MIETGGTTPTEKRKKENKNKKKLLIDVTTLKNFGINKEKIPCGYLGLGFNGVVIAAQCTATF